MKLVKLGTDIYINPKAITAVRYVASPDLPSGIHFSSGDSLVGGSQAWYVQSDWTVRRIIRALRWRCHV